MDFKMLDINFVDEMDAMDGAYEFLAERQGEAFEAADRVVRLKFDLDLARAAALAGGEINGKNEAQREAELRVLFRDAYNSLQAAEGRARFTRHQADVAQLEVDRIRLRVRLMELAAGQERAA